MSLMRKISISNEMRQTVCTFCFECIFRFGIALIELEYILHIYWLHTLFSIGAPHTVRWVSALICPENSRRKRVSFHGLQIILMKNRSNGLREEGIVVILPEEIRAVRPCGPALEWSRTMWNDVVRFHCVPSAISIAQRRRHMSDCIGAEKTNEKTAGSNKGIRFVFAFCFCCCLCVLLV